jgi:hypothetical protein
VIRVRPDLNGRDRPAANRTASNVTDGDFHSLRPQQGAVGELDPFTWGVLTDAYNTGHRLWWLKRARDFENAKPLPGEYHGNATPVELSARWRWCDEIARACRAKAEMVGADEEIAAILREVS